MTKERTSQKDDGGGLVPLHLMLYSSDACIIATMKRIILRIHREVKSLKLSLKQVKVV